MFHPSIVKAVAPSAEASRTRRGNLDPQACVVAWPSVAWHAGVQAKGFNPKPNPKAPREPHAGVVRTRCVGCWYLVQCGNVRPIAGPLRIALAKLTTLWAHLGTVMASEANIFLCQWHTLWRQRSASWQTGRGKVDGRPFGGAPLESLCRGI